MSAKSRTDDATALQAVAPTMDGTASSQTPLDEARALMPMARAGRFVLLREIGSGGMGSVFAAYDEQLDRRVALKILRKAKSGNAMQRLRTLREARAAARISHPNVIAIYEVGEADGNIHIAMEFVEGNTLLEWQAQGGRSWRDTLEMYLQVGEGLLAAHAADVVHRDFKPDNVLIGQDGRPRVVDFGLARVGWVDGSGEVPLPAEPPEPEVDVRVSGRLTLPGVISGTPGYMSPEQYRGGDVDSRSDQWSFCAALYEALYGHLPFSGSTLREHAERVHGLPRPPPSGTPVPDEIHRALLRGLSVNPAQRFPSMAELIAILTQEQRGDIAAGGIARQRFTRVFVIASIILLTLLQIRRSQRLVTPRDTVMVSAVLAVVVLIAGLWRRRTLLSNRFHRHAWILIMVTVLQNLLQRLMGVVLNIPLSKLLPFEMIVLAGSGAIAAATLMRGVYYMPAIPLLAGILSVVFRVPERYLSLTYVAIVISMAIGWNQAAKIAPNGNGDSEPSSGSTGRTRRTPSRPTHRTTTDRSRRTTPEMNSSS